jgi:prepilin-type N-terminal cleavage/methylation domain-containing protein
MTCARGSSPFRSTSRGFTLTELLTVLTIVVLIAGLSVGVLVGLPARYEKEQALSSLRSLFQRARAAAIEGGGASVRVEGGAVSARGWQLLLLLRFEDVLSSTDGAAVTVRGARGMHAKGGGVSTGPGRHGEAAYLEQPGAYLDCGNAPLLSPQDGLRIQLWLMAGSIAEHPGELPGGYEPRELLFPIIVKGEEYGLYLRGDYALEARLGRGEGAAPCVRETPRGMIRPGVWTEVALHYDGEDVALYVDGLRRELVPDPESDPPPVPPKLTPSDAALVISTPDPQRSLYAVVDELYVRGVFAEGRFELPQWMRLEGPELVRFDRFGQLDPLHHDGPARFVVYAQEEQSPDDSPTAPDGETVARADLAEGVTGGAQPTGDDTPTPTTATAAPLGWRELGAFEILRSGAVR